MKPKIISLVFIALLITLLAIPASSSLAQNDKDKDKNKGRVTICHVAGNSDDPANYVTITISENGLNGHMKDGSPRAGHENDFFGPCPVDASDDSEGDILSDSYVPIKVKEAVCTNVLVYHTDITGDWEIFRLGNAGENSLNLSQGSEAIDMQPSLSPDKRWVAFASNRDGDWEIFVSRTNGKFIQQVTFNETDDMDPVWSPLGGQIIYQSARNNGEKLIVLDVLTGEETMVTDDSFNNTDPYWSADASTVIFQRNGTDSEVRQIFELTLATLEIRQVTTGDLPSTDAQYSPDGQWIAYRTRDGLGNSILYIVSTEGSIIQTISSTDANATNLAWSPDSNLVAYQSNRSGEGDIYIFELATGTTRKLTRNAATEYAPTWYCGSTTVVFTSDVTNDANLFALEALPITADAVDITKGMGQLTTSDSAEEYPQSSPLDEDASRVLSADSTK